MNHSVANITCSNCKEEFYGVLNELFDMSKNYAAECPKCGEKTLFYGVGAFVDTDIPTDAVIVRRI